MNEATATMLLLAIVLPMLLSALLLMARGWWRRSPADSELSAVTRQHIELFQGGQLSEELIEKVKLRFRALLERGEVATVEQLLQPGIHYVVQVRALAEIGTHDAAAILERQLQRRLSDDSLEQTWYWIDLANGLRVMGRDDSLPHLLRCAEVAGDAPLAHFFAAEIVCFLGFAGYVRQPDSSLGQAALRTLHRALEGLRLGVPPIIVAEGRVGETIESLWDHRPERAHPLLVRVVIESLRLVRRAPHVRLALAEHGSEQEVFDLQLSRLAVLEPVLTDYLQEAPRELCRQLPTTMGPLLHDLLQSLHELRAEAAPAVLPLLPHLDGAMLDVAVEVLRWSPEPHVGQFLRDWVKRRISPARRGQWRRRAFPPRRPSVPTDLPYRAILRALRGHPSLESEQLLVVAAEDWDPTYRAAAVGSLGWWQPLELHEVHDCLQDARRDVNPDVRLAARAALARLGERQALQWFRQALASDEPQQVHEAVQMVASEGLTLLWPDLDRLVDAENPEIAQHTRESLERLFEDMERRRV